MASDSRKELATQVNSEISSAVRRLAQSEGRQLRALVNEALTDLIEKHKQARPRAGVMAAYQASHEKLGRLYKKLAE